MSAGSEGFLGRWSRRKEALRRGVGELPEPAELPAKVEAKTVATPPETAPLAVPATDVPATPATARNEPAATEAASPALPTLDDVATLTPASDFRRFVAPEVEPAVKNAALKKLFTDPQFNVMDGLDTYIDDYNKPDPLPESMLRQMVQAQFLGLFRDEEKPAEASAEVPDENADLRLQSHDAVEPDDAGASAPGAGEDGGCER
jgi:hypothetical protein